MTRLIVLALLLLIALVVMDLPLYGLLVAAWVAFYAALNLLARFVADIDALLRGDID